MGRRIEDRVWTTARGEHGPIQARCRVCGSVLHNHEVKIVVSSQALGKQGLPIEERMICGQCFLVNNDIRPFGAKPTGRDARRKVATSMLAR